MRPRKKGQASAAGNLDVAEFKVEGFKGRGYVPTPRSQMVGLSYQQLALRKRQMLSKVEGLKDSIAALQCDPEMLVEAYEAKKHLVKSDLDLPEATEDPPHQPPFHDGKKDDEAHEYNAYGRERLWAVFNKFDNRGIGLWSLSDFRTFTRACGREEEFKNETHNQKMWETLVMKRYASVQRRGGLDFEGFVRLHWDCQLTRNVHIDINALNLPTKSLIDRERQRVYDIVRVVSSTWKIDIKLPEEMRIKLINEGKRAVRLAIKDGKKPPRINIPQFLDLDFDPVLPEHVPVMLFALYKKAITCDHGKEIIDDIGWTENKPYVLLNEFVEYCLTRTTIVENVQGKMREQTKEQVYKGLVPLSVQSSIEERTRPGVAYFTLRTSILVRWKFLRIRAALTSIGKVSEMRSALKPPPVKTKKRKQLAALSGENRSKEEQGGLKSGIQINLNMCVGDLDKRMFSNPQGAENLVVAQIDWTHTDSMDLTEVLDDIDAPDKCETFILMEFLVHDFVPADRLNLLEMGIRGVFNVYARPIFESIPNYHSFTISYLEEDNRIFRLCLFFSGKAIHIRGGLGLHTQVGNLLRHFTYRFDVTPGEKAMFSANRMKLAILNDLFKMRGTGSFTLPRKHVLEYLDHFQEAFKLNPEIFGSCAIEKFLKFVRGFLEWTDIADIEVTAATLSKFLSDCTWLQDIVGEANVKELTNTLESPGGFSKFIEKNWMHWFNSNFEETQGHIRRGLNKYKQDEYTEDDYKLFVLHGLFVESVKGIGKVQFQCSERGFKCLFTNFGTQEFAKMAMHNPGGKS